MEYPRAWDATITYAESGETEVIREGENADALEETEQLKSEKTTKV